MLKVDPSLEFIASGAYPQGGRNWIENSAKPISRVAPIVAYHRYENIAGACIFDYTTPERTVGVYADASRWADESIAALGRFRSALPRARVRERGCGWAAARGRVAVLRDGKRVAKGEALTLLWKVWYNI